MLSDIEKQQIEAEMASFSKRRSACVGALKVVQTRRGHVSDEAMRDLAELLRMTPDELEGVATFSNLIFRHPVGQKVLKVCDSVVCWALGGQSLMEHLEQRIGIRAGETTADGRFTLLPICCLGDCDHAPVMMVNDEIVHEVTPQVLDEILSKEA